MCVASWFSILCYEDTSKDAVLQYVLFQNVLNLPELGGGILCGLNHKPTICWLVG